MPANLPPHYFEAEKLYRDAKTTQAKIEALEEMLTIMPKHKGTDKLRADLRRRIAKLKEQAQQKKGASKRETAYIVEKEGAAQVVVVGPPNTGKSSLVAALTNARPEVAAFPHSTWKPTPGMAHYQNVQFQLVDMPPVKKGYIDPWMADLMRRADILVLLLDLHADPLQDLEESLSILESMRIFPEGFAVPENLGKPPFVKSVLVVINKIDDEKDKEDLDVFVELMESNLPCLGISTQTGSNLPAFLEKMYQMSGIMRIYTKAPGKEPNLAAPFVIPKGSTLTELAVKIHKDFLVKMKFAKIWGIAVFDGQMVQREHILRDGDIVEIHI